MSMHSRALLLAALLLPALAASAPSAASAVEADEAAWETILESLKNKGEYRPPDSGVPPYFTLKKLSGPADKDHQAEHVTAMGLLDVNGRFHLTEIRFVSETWTRLPDGRRRIDQWLLAADVVGTLKDGRRYVRVLGTASDEVPTKPVAVRAQFLELVKMWGAQ